MNLLSSANHKQSCMPKMSFKESNSGLKPMKRPGNFESNPTVDDHHLPTINHSHSNYGDAQSRASDQNKKEMTLQNSSRQIQSTSIPIIHNHGSPRIQQHTITGQYQEADFSNQRGLAKKQPYTTAILQGAAHQATTQHQIQLISHNRNHHSKGNLGQTS